MPPKYKVSKEEITNAAYQVLCEQGETALTSRAIAEQLGVSSRPIYSFFPSMEDLLQVLMEKCNQEMQEYMRKNYTIDPFLNMGIGYVSLWKEKPTVFDFLHQSPTGIYAIDEQMIPEYLEKMKDQPYCESLDDEDFITIYQTMSIFTYGLVQYFKISKENIGLEDLILMLEDAGEAQFVHKIWKKNQKTVKNE